MYQVILRCYSKINNFYTTTVNDNSSEVVRMIRIVLSAELLHHGMDLPRP